MESLTLVVRYADGSVTCGESAVRETGKVISEVSVEPEGTSAPPGVISAIEAADVVVLSPGSLFTSTIPSLLGAGVREALAERAKDLLGLVESPPQFQTEPETSGSQPSGVPPTIEMPPPYRFPPDGDR